MMMGSITYRTLMLYLQSEWQRYVIYGVQLRILEEFSITKSLAGIPAALQRGPAWLIPAISVIFERKR